MPVRPAPKLAEAPETDTPEELKLTPEPVTEKAKKKPMKLLAAPKKFHWWLKKLSKKQLILFVAGVTLLLGGAGYAAYTVLKDKPAPEAPALASIPEPEPPAPTTVASRLTGVQIEPALNELPSTGVMIENSPDARPQSGLNEAGVIFEAIAEGGITRFLALYQESKPANIGPVRSVRPYYLDFLMPFDAPIAHAGGSAEGLAQIRSQGIRDLDHGANGSTYSRVSSRYAPHNLYTSRDRLLEAQTKRGYTTSTYTGFARKDAETPSAAPTANTISLTISSALYNPSYTYDAATNNYNRSLGGKPHTDESSGKQLAPKVVVALVMSHHYSGIYSVYGVNSSGVAYFFQDGVSVKGTWSKAGRTDQFVFKDAAGEIMKLNPGQTWVSVVASEDRIKVTP